MSLFKRFDDGECRAWIDALLAIVRLPPSARDWVG